MIGTKLGPYEIVEQIGEGGMATVYRAYQPSVDRYVAVKVIRPSIAEDAGAMARFQREARVVARLEHVHVLPIYDLALDPPYLVMRYLEGGTLGDVLRRGRLPLQEVGFLLRQVAAALDYAHRQGVVHRDVKPSNILLDGHGNAFVSDFGIARVVGQEVTQSGALMGTPGYMAPEQITGGGMDHRADLYALGAMAFEMLTGQLPYPAENPAEALFKHVNEPVPSACALNADLPVVIDEVLRRALAKDPAARYATASELTETIVEALGENVARTPTSLQTAVQASIQRIAAEREERKGELEATLASFAAERGEKPARADLARDEGHTPTERNRLVTALYANLAEVAEYAAGEGTEAVRDTLERLWERLERVIADRGGRVQARTYETALALWGTEAAREDDPERAVRTALEMQDMVREFLGDQEDKEPLPMQAGITTGLALLAPGEGEGSDAIASGPTISLAHRLERVTPPGGILISHDTYRHVRGLFDVEAGDPLRVRGRRRSLETYVVRAAKPRAFRLETRGVEDVETRMVGRRAELERLQEAFYAAVEDKETQVVTVAGGPGLGKSRLLYEFTNWVELEGIDLWLARGRATPETAGRPYALLRDLFSFRFGIQDSDGPEAVRARLEEGIAPVVDPAGAAKGVEMAHFIGRLLGYDLDSPHLADAPDDAQAFHMQALHYLVQFFEHVARQSPALVALDGVHWADASSLDAIDHLVRRHQDLPLLVVCLARPELYERRPAWGGGQPFHTRLDLRPLSRRESRRLVTEILQRVDEVPDALRDLVVERADGNPFYVEEMIKVLIEDRVIVKGDDGWTVEVERLSGVRVPSTLTGVIQARLDGLFPAERVVLHRAAVAGRIFWDDAVRALGAADGVMVDVAHALRGLAERELVHVREASALTGQEYIFASAVVHEVVLKEIPGRQRRAYHGCVAEWLAARGGERADEYAGLIADHLERAGEGDRAVAYLRRAGERAAAQFANAEAVVYFSRALDLVPEDGAQRTPERIVERYALLLARERVYALQGDREAQGQDLASLGELTEALGDNEERAEVAVRQAHYSTRIGEHEQAISAAQAAVRLAQAVQDAGREAMAYREWGRALMYQGKYKAARPHLERALALARDARLRRVEAEILHTLGSVLGYLGNDERSMDCWEQELRICRQIGDRRREGEALRDVGFAYMSRGNWTAGEGYLRQSLSVCRETGNRRDEAWALLYLGAVSYYQGDYAAARDCCEQGLRICREVHDRVGERVVLKYLGYFCIALADYAAARDYLKQALRMCREAGDQRWENWALVELGLVFHLQGDYASARTCYEQALHIGREIDLWPIEAKALLYTGLLSHHLGDDRAAREYSQQALLVTQNLDVINAMGVKYVFSTLGHALAGLGHPAQAADAYQQGLTLRREKEQHHLAVEPLAGLARVALAQGDPAGALAHVGEILDYLEDHPALEGTLEPLRIYLTCYRVLQANGDGRAVGILEAAHRLLQERAAKIDDKDLRRSFLGNVAAHQDILAEWEKQR